MEPSSIGGEGEVVVATTNIIEEQLLEAAQSSDARSQQRVEKLGLAKGRGQISSEMTNIETLTLAGQRGCTRALLSTPARFRR
jgi:hypothetical protein